MLMWAGSGIPITNIGEANNRDSLIELALT